MRGTDVCPPLAGVKRVDILCGDGSFLLPPVWEAVRRKLLTARE